MMVYKSKFSSMLMTIIYGKIDWTEFVACSKNKIMIVLYLKGSFYGGLEYLRYAMWLSGRNLTWSIFRDRKKLESTKRPPSLLKKSLTDPSLTTPTFLLSNLKNQIFTFKFQFFYQNSSKLTKNNIPVALYLNLEKY